MKDIILSTVVGLLCVASFLVGAISHDLKQLCPSGKCCKCSDCKCCPACPCK